MARPLPLAVPDNTAERLSDLVDAHHDRLYRLARRLAQSADDALDLVQETYLRAARSPKAVPVDARDAEAWLVRVLVNLQRDLWRKAAVRKRYERQARRPVSVDPGIDAVLHARSVIWSALDALTPRRRAVVVLLELEGLTVPAVASLLGISAITVRWHLAMGRRDLSQALHPQPGGTK